MLSITTVASAGATVFFGQAEHALGRSTLVGISLREDSRLCLITEQMCAGARPHLQTERLALVHGTTWGASLERSSSRRFKPTQTLGIR